MSYTRLTQEPLLPNYNTEKAPSASPKITATIDKSSVSVKAYDTPLKRITENREQFNCREQNVDFFKREQYQLLIEAVNLAYDRASLEKAFSHNSKDQKNSSYYEDINLCTELIIRLINDNHIVRTPNMNIFIQTFFLAEMTQQRDIMIKVNHLSFGHERYLQYPEIYEQVLQDLFHLGWFDKVADAKDEKELYRTLEKSLSDLLKVIKKSSDPMTNQRYKESLVDAAIAHAKPVKKLIDERVLPRFGAFHSIPGLKLKTEGKLEDLLKRFIHAGGSIEDEKLYDAIPHGTLCKLKVKLQAAQASKIADKELDLLDIRNIP